MGTVLLDISMSLDGYVAGPEVGEKYPLGRGGERLHEWLSSEGQAEVDAEVLRRLRASLGAVVIGRRMFDVGVGIWNDVPYPVPTFVLTHAKLPPREEKSGTFTFVDDAEKALLQAGRAAGEKSVLVMGGGDSAQECLRTGLIDTIQLHVVPVLLGGGARLFGDLPAPVELVPDQVLQSDQVTHLRYSVKRLS